MLGKFTISHLRTNGVWRRWASAKADFASSILSCERVDGGQSFVRQEFAARVD